MSESEYWTRFMRHQVSRRSLLKAGTMAGAGLWVGSALGCGSKQEAKPGQTTSGDVKIKKGGTLNYVFGYNPTTFDPHTTYSVNVQYPLLMVYNLLVRYVDKVTPDEQVIPEIVPELAESWERPDAKTWVFRLAKGVKWQNKAPVNGRPFTADDVVYNFKRIQTPDPKFLFSAIFKGIEVSKVDDYTVKFDTKVPNAGFLGYLTDLSMMMLPRELVENDTIKKDYCGTGPFILKSFKQDESWEFERNPEYWQKDKAGNQLPYLDKMIWPIITDRSTALAAMRNKKIDIGSVTDAELESFKKDVPTAVIERFPAGSFTFVIFRVDRPPFDNKKLRQALMYATDWKAYVKVSSLFQEGKRNGPFQWWLQPWVLPEAELNKYGPDLEKAKKLMAEAGYPEGKRLKVTVPTCPSYGMPTWDPVTASAFKQVGVDIEFSQMETGSFLNKVWEGKDFPVYNISTYAYSEPDYILRAFYSSTSPSNYSFYKNPKVDELMDKANQEFDKEKRKQIYWEVQKVIMDDAPQIFLYTGYTRYMWHDYVHGYVPMAQGRQSIRTLPMTWLDK